MIEIRRQNNMEQVNKWTVKQKTEDIMAARHYVYKEGELEAIAERKFERAMQEGTLSHFPNVTYFLKKKEAELFKLQQKSEGTESIKEADREALIAKIEKDIGIIKDFLSTDLRMTKFNSEEGGQHKVTIENIEE